ncbi:MAG: hypothetical protein GY774_35775 [Planctomycetes bacterium]|nr:hypothetical protein [Planctomycetota bacterium]
MATIETYPGTQRLVDAIADVKSDLEELNAEIAALTVGGVSFSRTAHTSDYTLVSSDLAGTKTLTNDGAVGAVNLSLPAGVATYRTAFEVMAAQELKFTASGAETIRYKGLQTAGGGYLKNSTIGGYLAIAWNGTEWIVSKPAGVWSDGTTDYNKSSATVIGPAELATSAENVTGTDTERASTPAGVKAAIEEFAKVVQTVNTITGASTTGTTQLPSDDTIPQITEGDEYMTLAITPTSATNNLIIDIHWIGSHTAADEFTVALFQDATASALVATARLVTNGYINDISLRHFMAAGTTSSTTFRVRAGSASAGTTTFNGLSGSRLYGGVLASSITITEVR